MVSLCECQTFSARGHPSIGEDLSRQKDAMVLISRRSSDTVSTITAIGFAHRKNSLRQGTEAALRQLPTDFITHTVAPASFRSLHEI